MKVVTTTTDAFGSRTVGTTYQTFSVIQGQAKTFIETLKKSVREVRITVTWKDGAVERSISASQQIVILPESVGKAGTDTSVVPGATTGAGTIQQLGTMRLPGAKAPSGDGSSQ